MQSKMLINPLWAASLVTALCIGRPSVAAKIPFTWNPAASVPPLVGGAFTADTMSYDFVCPFGGTTLRRLCLRAGGGHQRL